MANRKQRSEIANETVAILAQGRYALGGRSVSMADALEAMRADTLLYTPQELTALVESQAADGRYDTAVEVRNCTTLAAARSLIDAGHDNPLCLNFASAKNPGGGFLSGSQAQEECLARASGLHASLLMQPAYYDINRAHRSSLYTHHLIYSPRVPVFRSDDDLLLEEPYAVSFVTSPAVNAGAIARNEPSSIEAIRPTMEARIRSVLAVARAHDHRALVLGAWGCGVFGNDPRDIATWFAEALFDDPRFRGAFDTIVFGVLDFAERAPTFTAFRDVLSPNASVDGA